MSWKDKFTLGAPFSVEHMVGDTPHKFYPMRARIVMRLRVLGPKVAKAAAVIFENKNKDFGQSSRQVQDKQGTVSEIIQEAQKPELVEMRRKALGQALDDVFNTLFDDAHQGLIADAIMDCMRDDFPAGDRPSAQEFFDTFDIPTVKDMIVGCAKANAKVFGSFGNAMVQWSARALAKVEAQAEETLDDQPQVDENP